MSVLYLFSRLKGLKSRDSKMRKYLILNGILSLLLLGLIVVTVLYNGVAETFFFITNTSRTGQFSHVANLLYGIKAATFFGFTIMTLHLAGIVFFSSGPGQSLGHSVYTVFKNIKRGVPSNHNLNMLIVLLFSVVVKLYYRDFDLEANVWNQVKRYADLVYYGNTLFYPFDDCLFYTYFTVGMYNLFGPDNVKALTMINILFGSLSNAALYRIFAIVLPKLWALLVGLLSGVYVTHAYIENMLRYDISLLFYHIFFILFLLLYIQKRNKINLSLLLVFLVTSVLTKETVIYYLPFLLLILFVSKETDKFDFKKGVVPFIVLLAIAWTFTIARDRVDIELWGVNSHQGIKNIMAVALQGKILTKDTRTSYPKAKERILEIYRKVLPNKAYRDNTILELGFEPLRSGRIAWIGGQRKRVKGKWDYFLLRDVKPFANELVRQNLLQFIGNGVQRFLWFSGIGTMKLKGREADISAQLKANKPLWLTNKVMHRIFIGYYVLVLMAIIQIILFEPKFFKKCIGLYLCIFPLGYGLFISIVTYAEFWRFLLLARGFTIGSIALLLYYLYLPIKQLITTKVAPGVQLRDVN
jgi:hypothetical protein